MNGDTSSALDNLNRFTGNGVPHIRSAASKVSRSFQEIKQATYIYLKLNTQQGIDIEYATKIIISTSCAFTNFNTNDFFALLHEFAAPLDLLLIPLITIPHRQIFFITNFPHFLYLWAKIKPTWYKY